MALFKHRGDLYSTIYIFIYFRFCVRTDQVSMIINKGADVMSFINNESFVLI